jgi:hypothetical protein
MNMKKEEKRRYPDRWGFIVSITFIGILIIAIIVIIVSVIKEMEREPKPNLFIQRHAPWLERRDIQTELLGIYIYTDENFNPNNYRVTKEKICRTFDGGKTWVVLFQVRKNSSEVINHMEACGCRSPKEKLPPGYKDIIIFVKKKKN